MGPWCESGARVVRRGAQNQIRPPNFSKFPSFLNFIYPIFARNLSEINPRRDHDVGWKSFKLRRISSGGRRTVSESGNLSGRRSFQKTRGRLTRANLRGMLRNNDSVISITPI